MQTFRFSRTVLRARHPLLTRPTPHRTYAEAIPDKIKLSLALPHQSIFKSQDVVQVNIPAASGDMGVLANHVPAIEKLRPGLVEVIEENAGGKKFFVSGGFAVFQPDSQLCINAVEAYPLEDFSLETVRSLLAEAQRNVSGGLDEQKIAEAKIEVEVLESLQTALK